MKSKLIHTAGMIALAGSAAWTQQPQPSIPVVNHPCQDGPVMNGSSPDTVATMLDSGFVSLFNGKDLKGWWENCTPHSADRVKGGVWLVDSSQGILFSREEGVNGGLLVTNQTYDHYEVVFDLWPTFGNDAGLFNRVTKNGKTWQTGIDYINGSGVGGSYNEASWSATHFNEDPFVFQDSPSNPTVSSDASFGWTNFTKNKNPAGFGCAANGCVSSDFTKIWDVNGWNQMRVKFYDGLEAGRSVTMETFLRKAGASNWTPIYKQTKSTVTPKGPIALQIHGDGRWKAGAYNLYRNIKIRALNIDGTPKVSVGLHRGGSGRFAVPDLGLIGGALTGTLSEDSEVTLIDIRGQAVETFRAPAGKLRHPLAAGYRGVLIAKVSNARGSAHVRLSRI